MTTNNDYAHAACDQFVYNCCDQSNTYCIGNISNYSTFPNCRTNRWKARNKFISLSNVGCFGRGGGKLTILAVDGFSMMIANFNSW